MSDKSNTLDDQKADKSELLRPSCCVEVGSEVKIIGGNPVIRDLVGKVSCINEWDRNYCFVRIPDHGVHELHHTNLVLHNPRMVYDAERSEKELNQ